MELDFSKNIQDSKDLGGIFQARKSQAHFNELPDSDFAYIEAGGKIDFNNRTVPRSLRHFPVSSKDEVIQSIKELEASSLSSGMQIAVFNNIHLRAEKLGMESQAGLPPWVEKKSEDKKSGLVSVSIEYYSPQIAKQWLDLYISAINKHMQERQVEKVSNNISYLEAQIEKTSIAEMREVFYTIIEEQTKNKMVAEASPDYAFVAVSPSMVPEEKSQPKRALICILGTLLGGMLSVLLVLVMHYAKKSD